MQGARSRRRDVSRRPFAANSLPNLWSLFCHTCVQLFHVNWFYVLQVAFGRFARKTSERVVFILKMSALVFRSRVLVALSVSCSLSKLLLRNLGLNQLHPGTGNSEQHVHCGGGGCLLCLQTLTDMEHQVDKRCKRGNSLDWVRCSWEGSFHACEGGFRQCRHGDSTGTGGLCVLTCLPARGGRFQY